MNHSSLGLNWEVHSTTRISAKSSKYLYSMNVRSESSVDLLIMKLDPLLDYQSSGSRTDHVSISEARLFAEKFYAQHDRSKPKVKSI